MRTNERTDGRASGKADGRTGGRADGRADKRTDARTDGGRTEWSELSEYSTSQRYTCIAHRSSYEEDCRTDALRLRMSGCVENAHKQGEQLGVRAIKMSSGRALDQSQQKNKDGREPIILVNLQRSVKRFHDNPVQ